MGGAFNNLAALYRAQLRFTEAEPLYKRSLAIREKALGLDDLDVGHSLNNLAALYQDQGRYTEAEPLIRRSLAVFEKAMGSDHPDVGFALNNLALIYQTQGRYTEAEPLYKRSLAVREKALGANHPDVAQSLNNLAGLYRDQGRYVEAEPLQGRSLVIYEKALGSTHSDVALAANNLALINQAQGRYPEAELLFKRSLTAREKALGPEHPEVGLSLNNLATLYQVQARYPEAEPLYKRSLAIFERALLHDHPNAGLALSNLALLYQDRSRFAEAELLYKRILSIFEKALGPDHPLVSTSLGNLAVLYSAQGRDAETEQLLKRSLAVAEAALGPDHPGVATSLNNLAGLYMDQGRVADAELLLRRSLAIRERAQGPDHPEVVVALINLAGLIGNRGRYAEAEPLYKRSLAIAEKVLGPEHPQVGSSHYGLALLYRDQGRFGEAAPLFKHSLAIWEKALGPDHPKVGLALVGLGGLASDEGDWARASDYWRRSTGLIKRRMASGIDVAKDGAARGEAQQASWLFLGLVKTTSRMVAEGRSSGSAPEMFETAQWAQASEAAASLAQMAARSAKGSPELGVLVRERQDLVGEWQARDKRLIAAKSEEPAKRNAAPEKALSDRLNAIDTRLAAIDARLAGEFPDYAALASPTPVSAAEVQAQLGHDEALVLFLDTPEWKPLPEETFIWIVTKSEVRWVRSELGTAALTREVAALRCGLDAAAWDGAGRERCATALGMPPPGTTPDPLPFDHARAHKLYMGLFGEVADLIKGRHLLIVPSGPLTQLPFQVLVTKPPHHHTLRAGSPPPCGEGLGVGGTTLSKVRDSPPPCPSPTRGEGTPTPSGGATASDPQGLTPAIAWLARSHAVTILPAVSSLKALRRVGRSSAAPRPMIGIGNPLLDGPDARYASDAQKAWAKQRCPDQPPRRLAARSDHRAGPARVETRGGLASVADIKGQLPLPETADELCAVAQDVKAETGRDILLGARATEREVKRLSAAGELAKYRMLHFATHGVLAGELKGNNEPGLILTPPATATEEDDGYLSASEIAALKLDADWVILSACNTAAGAAASAEALSGLARAFIYAQARALLVSHWAVDSDATVKLITAAAREMAREPQVGRAEALRRSMLALIDKGAPHEAHPAYWAPFVVVGEGGRGR